MTSAWAAGRVFDFRSFLLTALQANQDAALVVDDSGAGEPCVVDAPADDQWVAWTDQAAESAWLDAELLDNWGAVAERLGWRT
jgi:hypothetical protein